MIINIPLRVDEQKMEDVIKRDYSAKVFDEIMKMIKKELVNESTTYYGDRAGDGLKNLVTDCIGTYLESHNDEIIKAAGKELAVRLARSKRGKELLEDVCGAS